MAQQQMMRQEASLGELFTDLADKTSTLIRQEAALVQTELTTKAVSAGKNVGYLAVGGFVGYAASLLLIAALVAGLQALGIPVWASALIVGVILAIASYVLINSALTALKNTNWAPKESIESIKEDAKWLKNQVD
jgi:drug/metabolite transporter (DMT)-like permease